MPPFLSTSYHLSRHAAALRRQFARERSLLPPHLRPTGGVLKKTSPTPTGGGVKKTPANVLHAGHRELAHPPPPPPPPPSSAAAIVDAGLRKRVHPPPPPPPSRSSPAADIGHRERVHLPPPPSAVGHRERVRAPSPPPRTSLAASTFPGEETLRCGTPVLVRTRVAKLRTDLWLVMWLSAVIVSSTEDGYVVVYNGQFPLEDPFGTVAVPRDHVKKPPPAAFPSAAAAATAPPPRQQVLKPAPRPTTGGKSLRLLKKLEPDMRRRSEAVLSCW